MKATGKSGATSPISRHASGNLADSKKAYPSGRVKMTRASMKEGGPEEPLENYVISIVVSAVVPKSCFLILASGRNE